MAAKSKTTAVRETEAARVERLARLEGPESIAGIPGPGRWLLAEFEPTTLFSLKISSATSSVGRTLVVPTPYAIKMALVDAGFRIGLSDNECDALLKQLVHIEVRISPASEVVVTHTFVKVRQESREGDPLHPYNSTIAYRELAYLNTSTTWAFDLVSIDSEIASLLIELLPHIYYIGKRGSFLRSFDFSERIHRPQYDPARGSPRRWSPPARAKSCRWTILARMRI